MHGDRVVARAGRVRERGAEVLGGGLGQAPASLPSAAQQQGLGQHRLVLGRAGAGLERGDAIVEIVIGARAHVCIELVEVAAQAIDLGPLRGVLGQGRLPQPPTTSASCTATSSPTT